MSTRLSSNANRPLAVDTAHADIARDSDVSKKPPLPQAPYHPYTDSAPKESPYEPYRKEPAQQEPPYEPYKDI